MAMNGKAIQWTVLWMVYTSLLFQSTIYFSLLLQCYSGIHNCPFFLYCLQIGLVYWLCVMVLKKCSFISGRDRFLQTILFFREMFSFTSLALGLPICTRMFMFLFQQLVTKKSRTNILKHGKAIIT